MKRIYNLVLVFTLLFSAFQVGAAASIDAYSNVGSSIVQSASDDIKSEWLFEEGEGSTAKDNIGKNDAKIYGAKWSDDRGLVFDGKDDYVSVKHSSSISPEQELTISAWVLTQENKTAKIAQKGDWDGYGIYQGKWEGWKATLITSDRKGYTLDWGKGVPEMNQWYYLVMTYDGAELQFYVDGELVASEKIGKNIKVNSRDFSIGADNGKQKFFNGSIDDVRFYGTAMTKKTILDLYNAQADGEHMEFVFEKPFAYDGFSGDDFGWSGAWFEYAVSNGNKVWNADFKGYNYAYSKDEVSLNYVDEANGISVKGGNVCVKATNTAKGSESAALSRNLEKEAGSWKTPMQQTFYLSFLAQFSDKPKKGWDYLAVGAKQSRYDAGVVLGSIFSQDKAGAVFAKDGGTKKHTSGKLPNADETYFVVGKFTTNSWGSVTEIDVFINPQSLYNEEAEWKANIKNSGNSSNNFYYSFNSIQLMTYFHDVAYFDEVRLGHTWGSVVSPLDNSAGSSGGNVKVTVFEGPTGYWNDAQKWSNGIPTADVDSVIIKGQCAVDEEVEAKDVVVRGNGKLYVKKGGVIKTVKPIVLEAVKDLVAEYIQEDKAVTYTVKKEQYFTGGQWSFVCVPYDMTADDLFPDMKLASSWSDPEAQYWLLDYSQEQRAKTKDGMKDVYDGDYLLKEGRGYIVWLDEDKLRTFEYESSKTEVSVSTTNSTETALSLNHAGWNLVGNPFSHTMSYAAVFDSSEHNQKYFTGAVYVWDGEEYKVWSRGVGDESAREIGPLEAFFVKRTSDDPEAAVFMMNDNGVYSSDNTIFSKSAQIEEESSTLAISLNLMKGRLSDQTYIKINNRASLGLDEDLDGLKLQTRSAYYDYIYSTDYDDVFAVNAVALEHEYAEVPLVVNLAQGMDSILVGFTLDGDSSYSFALVDEDEMTMRPIEHGDFLKIATDYEGKIEGRFSVFITKSVDVVTDVVSQKVDVNRLGNIYAEGNKLVVKSMQDVNTTVSVIGFDGKIYDSSIIDSRGMYVKPLKTGVYLVRLSNGSSSIVEKVVVK